MVVCEGVAGWILGDLCECLVFVAFFLAGEGEWLGESVGFEAMTFFFFGGRVSVCRSVGRVCAMDTLPLVVERIGFRFVQSHFSTSKGPFLQWHFFF